MATYLDSLDLGTHLTHPPVLVLKFDADWLILLSSLEPESYQ